jgi:hypothetical protein
MMTRHLDWVQRTLREHQGRRGLGVWWLFYLVAQQHKLAENIMVINQGDVYWVALKEPAGSDSGVAQPHVVIQEDILNRSRIETVVVCAL